MKRANTTTVDNRSKYKRLLLLHRPELKNLGCGVRKDNAGLIKKGSNAQRISESFQMHGTLPQLSLQASLISKARGMEPILSWKKKLLNGSKSMPVKKYENQ